MAGYAGLCPANLFSFSYILSEEVGSLNKSKPLTTQHWIYMQNGKKKQRYTCSEGTDEKLDVQSLLLAPSKRNEYVNKLVKYQYSEDG